MAYTYIEKAGSPTVNLGKDSATAVRTFRVDWRDRFELASDLSGGWIKMRDANGNDLLFLKEPIVFPGFSNMSVSTISIEPDLPDSPDGGGADLFTRTNTYRYAEIVANYEQVQKQDQQDDQPPSRPGTGLTIERSFGAEFLTTAGRNWYWGSPTGKQLPADLTPGQMIATTEIEITWDRAPVYPASQISGLVGTVNSSSFAGVGAKRLLFRGIDTAFEVRWESKRATTSWSITYQFSERPENSPNWQSLWDEESMSWNEPTRKNGEKLYVERSFDAMFV